MPEQLSMDEILGGTKLATKESAPEPKVETPAAAAPKEPAPEPKVERVKSIKDEWAEKENEAQGRVRDPTTGQFVAKPEPKAEVKEEPKPEPKPEVKAAPVQEELTPKEKAAFAKAADETRKRQALERQIAEMQAQARPAVDPNAPAKTFWDDPEGALARQKQEIHQAIVGTRLQTSESIARSRHEDFDEKVIVFTDLAKNTPGLVQQMMSAPDPAEFVYRTAKSHKELQEAGGIDALREKITAETEVKIRAKIEDELKAKAAVLAKERAALPGSITDVQSKGPNRQVWGGPTSMSEILKPR